MVGSPREIRILEPPAGTGEDCGVRGGGGLGNLPRPRSFLDTIPGNAFSWEVTRGGPGTPGTEPLPRARLTFHELLRPWPRWDPECSKEG